MQSLLDTIRKAAKPAIWSQGVKLARDKAVARVAKSDHEITVRVRDKAAAIAPTVTLYLEDDEWGCDCGGKIDPCNHVTAAVIACSKGEETEAPVFESTEKIVYHLGKRDRLLSLTRFIVGSGGKEEKITTSLSSLLAKSEDRPLNPSHDDLRIDRILGPTPRELVPLAKVADILGALAGVDDVFYDGKKVVTSREPVPPQAIIEDAPNDSFLLRMERNPEITEVVAFGVARCGDTLQPLGETGTTGDLLERLPLSRVFPKEQTTELVTNVIAELEKRLTVIVNSRKLPRAKKGARPRVAMDLSHHGHTLSVLPTLVYGDPPIARVDGDTIVALGKEVPVRRVEEERELLRRLRDELNLVPGRRVDLDGNEAIRFAAKLRTWQSKTGEEPKQQIEHHTLTPRVLIDDEMFDVVFEAIERDDHNQPRRASTEAVLKAWRDGLSLVPINGGGWAPLPIEWLEKHGHRVADLLAARDEDKKLVAAALPDLGALCDALDTPRPLSLKRLEPLLKDFSGIPKAALPKDLHADLRTYQHVGVDWLGFIRDASLGAILADDMGLGKTLQTICAINGRTLVICPKSVVYNWADEIARFRPGLKTSIYHGTKRELDDKADVTLTTYAVLRMDVSHLAEIEWDAIVLDEAQAIKNATSQTAKAAFELRGKFRAALSGTPVENRLEELWSVMHFANPGLLGGRSDFQTRYATPIAAGDKDAQNRLRSKIRPFVLRRLKRDVIPELPPRTDSVLHIELDEIERGVYDAVRAATKKDITEKLAKGSGVLAALEALLRLRQAACHAQLVPGQNAESSSKIERLLEALEEAKADGHKALVFSQWTSLLDLVEPHLKKAEIPFARLDGSTRDRAGVVNTFQSENGPPVMLVSLKAGGTGLNLTAADHVFLLDPWWNPAVEDQAADRAHRIGQDKPVMVYRMVAKDTVEERIFALQHKKRALADVALGNADHGGGITKEELLALLE